MSEVLLNKEAIAAKIQAGLHAQQAGDFSSAETAYKEVLAKVAGHFDATHLLGVLYLITNRQQLAEQYLSEATAINPNSYTAFYNLGLCLDNLGKKSAAVSAYSNAIHLNPQDHRSLNNRSKSLREQGNLQQSLLDAEKAIELKPDYAAAYHNRGIALRDLRRMNDAMTSYIQALQINPNLQDALYSIGNLLIEQKRYDEAIPPLSKLLSQQPDYPYALGALFSAKLHGCDWTDYEKFAEVIASRVRAGLQADVPFSFLAYSKSVSDQYICSLNYTKHKYPPSLAPIYKGERYQHQKIRVAYLSADFHNHATSYLMAGLFEAHSKDQFEFIAVSFGPDGNDEMRQRLTSCFSQFINVRNMPDEDVAKLLRQMEVDIAVDLKGFTGDSRTSIFTYRAAPIQINYLGYPGTMGASYIDYIIADPHVIPEEHRAYYTEKIMYLPDTYQANDDKRAIAPAAMPRAEAGLPESGFVFCCFNNNYKITPEIFDVWMRLLKQVEGSVLWLLDDNPTALKNLKKEAVARGISQERLVFAGRVKVADHLARQKLADLFLDTLPYNAHTTASDALWAGLPIVTCCGASFAGRVATSLLNAVGMQELVTESLQDYEEMALNLARTPDKLNALRDKLQTNINTQALFNTKRFCEKIESAYLQAWQLHQAGKAADHIFIHT